MKTVREYHQPVTPQALEEATAAIDAGKTRVRILTLCGEVVPLKDIWNGMPTCDACSSRMIRSIQEQAQARWATFKKRWTRKKPQPPSSTVHDN